MSSKYKRTKEPLEIAVLLFWLDLFIGINIYIYEYIIIYVIYYKMEVTTMDDISKLSNKIVDKLKLIFKEDKFNVYAVYGGRSIVIDSKDESLTRVYIRVYGNNKECRVDISSVGFDDDIIGKGYFRGLVESIGSVEGVKEIIVSNTCTDIINIVCDKLGFKKNKIYNGYSKVI